MLQVPPYPAMTGDRRHPSRVANDSDENCGQADKQACGASNLDIGTIREDQGGDDDLPTGDAQKATHQSNPQAEEDPGDDIRCRSVGKQPAGCFWQEALENQCDAYHKQEPRNQTLQQ